MRTLVFLSILFLYGCLDTSSSGSTQIDPEPRDNAISLTLYTYDVENVTAVQAVVGDTIRLDASSHNYDTSLAYHWVAWT